LAVPLAETDGVEPGKPKKLGELAVLVGEKLNFALLVLRV
jgi:hypothetical protein